MLIVINDSIKENSTKVRAIIGRYCWRVARDVWINPRMSVRLDLLKELTSHQKEIRILFLWTDSKKALGFSWEVHGNLKERANKDGLFNHRAPFNSQDGQVAKKQ